MIGSFIVRCEDFRGRRSMSSHTGGYRIKTVCEITGVARNTLLAWERRYGFVQPVRAANGYRLYSEYDVALIRQVKEVVDRGWAISEAIGYVLMQRRAAEAEASNAVANNPASTHVELLEALLDFDRVRAEAVMRQVDSIPIESIIADFFSPVLANIGQGWVDGKYTIAQEHFASGFVRDQLVAILLRLGCGPEDGKVAVCCCYPDDQHELGLLMVAIRLAMRSWRITWLGSRMPEDSLVQFLNKHPPAMVCISITLERDVVEVESFARRVRKAVPSKVEVVMGGPGVRNVKAVEGVRFVEDPGRI